MDDCQDPSGVAFSALDPALLRGQRTSVKWTRYPADVLPLFVAEMDFALAPIVQQRLIERIQASDTGYLDAPGPLAPAFADFARERWGWEVRGEHVHLATDVATAVVEAIRVAPRAARIALPTPVYPGFFEMLEEVAHELIEIPLAEEARPVDAPGAIEGGFEGVGSPTAAHPAPRLDLAAIERAFAAGTDVFLLCNPHNPHGLVHSHAELSELARLAAAHDVFVISDEIHAPLTHHGQTFTPFAPLAAAAGALAVTATSASKGWNLAGAKCALLIAADDRANEILQGLPPETTTRASILGLHANVAAFAEGQEWLDRAIVQIEANERLLAELVQRELPGVRYVRPQAGYLAWLDFGGTGIGSAAAAAAPLSPAAPEAPTSPAAAILRDARVALNDGAHFGLGGEGWVRLNLACAPATIVEAVRRISAILRPENAASAASGPQCSETSDTSDTAETTEPTETQEAAR